MDLLLASAVASAVATAVASQYAVPQCDPAYVMRGKPCSAMRAQHATSYLQTKYIALHMEGLMHTHAHASLQLYLLEPLQLQVTMGSTTAEPKLVPTLALGAKAAHSTRAISASIRPAGSHPQGDAGLHQDQQVSSPPAALLDVLPGLQPLPGLGPLMSGGAGAKAGAALAAGALGHDVFGDVEDGSGDDDDDMQQLQAIMQRAVEVSWAVQCCAVLCALDKAKMQ